MTNNRSCRGVVRPRPLAVIAAGGTGGHVFPAVCLANSFSDDGVNVIFFTDARGARYTTGLSCHIVRQNIATTPRWAMYISLIFNALARIWTLRRLKPDVVVGFGGYPSVPCALAAQALRIKTIIHEQNAVIGLANKLLSKMATKILTSFPQTIGIRDSPKVIRVGNPTRFENRYGAVGKPSNRVFTILIFGGSQGSMVFAKVIPPVVRELAKSFPIKVFHQCQVEAIEDLRQTYSTHGISHLVSGFFDNIGELYEEADLVISRAGASSVSEIIGFQKPSILIPFKNSINGDQKANAEFLQTRNAAFVIDETDELGAKLKTLIESVASDKSKLTSIADALRSLRLADCTLNMKRIVTKEALGF